MSQQPVAVKQKEPITLAVAKTMAYTFEHLVIQKFYIMNETGIIDPTTPTKGYAGNTFLFLEGTPVAPYTMVRIQVIFVDDNELLPPPSWQQPYLVVRKHWYEYESMMDIVKRGIENKLPGTELSALFIVELAQLNIILSM